MILIVGGSYQGKLDFACDLTGYGKDDFADGRSCSLDELRKSAGVKQFHACIRREAEKRLKEVRHRQDCESVQDVPGDLPDKELSFPDTFAHAFAKEIISANPDLVIISDEIGCGIIPMDRSDRIVRECTGRTLTQLAAFSEKVFRVTCGIGVCIKNRQTQGDCE